MKLVNIDLTRKSVTLYVSQHQIYAEIRLKVNGKWRTSTFLQSYDFLIDEELIESTIKYIIRLWGLKNPKVEVEFVD